MTQSRENFRLEARSESAGCFQGFFRAAEIAAFLVLQGTLWSYRTAIAHVSPRNTILVKQISPPR